MEKEKKAVKWLSLICIIFLIYMVLTSPISMYIGQATVANKVNGTQGYIPLERKPGTSSYYITEFTGYELLNDIEANVSIVRSIQFVKNKMLRIFFDLAPITGLSVSLFIYYYFCCLRRRRRQLSVLTILMGGHAPPIRLISIG